jgi:hypothetical protein
MNTIKFAKKLAIPLFVALAYVPSQALAQSILGADLSSFAVFGRTGVSSAGLSTIGGGGDVGTFTVNAITGAGVPYNLGGAANYSMSAGSFFQSQTTSALGAADDLGYAGGVVVAGTAALGSLPGTTTAQARLALAAMANTGGTGLTDLSDAPGPTAGWAPGVYDFGAGLLGLNKTITLDGGYMGSNGTTGANSVWVFRFASTLTTDATSSFSMVNVGDGANVGLYWSAGSSATLDGNTWAGNVLTGTTITSNGFLDMGCGRLLAGTAVTLDGVVNTVSTGCNGYATTGFDRVAEVPEPETYAILLAGLGLMGFVARRRQRNLAAAA